MPKPPLITEIPNTPITSKLVTSQLQVVDPTNTTSLAHTQIAVEPLFQKNSYKVNPHK